MLDFSKLGEYAGTFFSALSHKEFDYSHVEKVITYLEGLIKGGDFHADNLLWIGAAIEELASIKLNPHPDTYRHVVAGVIILTMVAEEKRCGPDESIGEQRYPKTLEELSQNHSLFNMGEYQFGARTGRIDVNVAKLMILDVGKRAFLKPEEPAHLAMPSQVVLQRYFPELREALSELGFKDSEQAVEVYKQAFDPTSTLTFGH